MQDQLDPAGTTPATTNTPSPISRRTALATVLATGAGVAVAQQMKNREPDGATPGPATKPAYSAGGQPALPEYVDNLPPGVPGPGTPTAAYAAPLAKQELKPIVVKRRPVGPDDVELEVLYCGLCHSDVHFVMNEWKNTIFPCVPGHEFVGRVTKVGANVSKFKVGDPIAVGPPVDSCGVCKNCTAHLEQYCEGPKGRTEAYNGPAKPDGTNTYGGYSKSFVVKQHFAYTIPKNLDLAAVAPLLCAGMTVYSPLVHWKAGPGMKVGVVGMGGLGHMAVKLAKALGAEVTVFSTTPAKESDAKNFGASAFLLSTDTPTMKKMELTQDLIINTIPYPYDPNTYIKLLARDGTMVNVGVIGPLAVPPDTTEMVMHRRTLAGSVIGNPDLYAPFLAFCGEKNITATIEKIPLEQVNEAYPKVVAKQARYRYVLDLENYKPAT